MTTVADSPAWGTRIHEATSAEDKDQILDEILQAGPELIEKLEQVAKDTQVPAMFRCAALDRRFLLFRDAWVHPNSHPGPIPLLLELTSLLDSLAKYSDEPDADVRRTAAQWLIQLKSETVTKGQGEAPDPAQVFDPDDPDPRNRWLRSLSP